MIATALDEAMALLLHGQEELALTGRLEVDLLAPAPVGTYVAVEADLEEAGDSKLVLVARASGDDGPLASARGVFVRRG